MRLIAIGLALGLAAGAATPAAAQGRAGPPGSGMERGAPPSSPRPSADDDRLAELDKRLSEIGDNLRLTPDQQKLYADVEQGVRGVVRQRFEAQEAIRERRAAIREARKSGERPSPRNVPEDLRMRAEASAAAADAMRRLADATTPLFEALDDRQRQRLGQIVPAMAQAGRRADPAGRGARRQPPAQQPQDPDDDADDDEPGDSASPPARGR